MGSSKVDIDNIDASASGIYNRANIIYLTLCCLFSVVIITGNLIFQKFVTIDFGFHVFEVSAGVVLFPLTFLISDLVTEFYGKKAATTMINIALFTCAVTILLISLGDYMTATIWSPVDDYTFGLVFNAFAIGAATSTIANYCGQLIEIHIYAKIKSLTSGRHLWLRNNISTIAGQLVDTILVVLMLTVTGHIPAEQAVIVIISSFSFKVIMAVFDTPLCYLGYYLISKNK